MRCRIALAFGDITFEKTDSLPLPIYRQWQRFFQQEPWGTVALDILHARDIQHHLQMHTKSRRTAEQMLLFRTKPKMTDSEIRRRMEALGWQKKTLQ